MALKSLCLASTSALALALCSSGAVAQSGGRTIVTPTSATRASLATVTQRPPNGLDVNGYVVGNLWRAPNGKWFKLLRVGSATSASVWVPTASPSGAPGDANIAVGTTGEIYATCAQRAGYTSHLFDLTRGGDLGTLTVDVYNAGTGTPNLAAIAKFLNDDVTGVGYITKFYGQVNTLDTPAQTALASAPSIDVNDVVAGCPTAVGNYDERAYQASFTNTAVSNVSTAVTMTNALSPLLAPSGLGVTGSCLQAGTTVSAINYTTNVITVSQAPSGSCTGIVLTFSQPKVWLDLNASVSVTHNAHSAWFIGSLPGVQTRWTPITLGVTGGTANGTGTTYSGLYGGGGGVVSNCRVIGQALTNSAAYTLNFAQTLCAGHSALGVFGYSRSARNVTLWAEENVLTGTVGTDPGAGAITGGSMINTQQFAAEGTVFGGDLRMQAIYVHTTAPTTAQGNLFVQAAQEKYGIYPHIRVNIVFGGTSTTRGTGASVVMNPARRVCDKLASNWPCRGYNFATGQSIEAEAQAFSINELSAYNANYSNILVVKPGIGNAIQATTSAITVSAVDTTVPSRPVLTIASGAAAYPSFLSLGAQVTVAGGGASVPAGTQVAAVNSPNNPTLLTLSQPISGGTPTSVTVIGDTGAQAAAATVSYLQAARLDGFKIVLNLPASRKSFCTNNDCSNTPTTQIQSWHDSKNILRSIGAQYADIVIDEEDDAAWGADTPMTVTGVNQRANQVTVASLSTCAAVNSFARWSGAPAPAVYITALAGNTITFSNAIPASFPGNQIRVTCPNPWTTQSAFWQTGDGQHPTAAGYAIDEDAIVSRLLSSSLLQ